MELQPFVVVPSELILGMFLGVFATAFGSVTAIMAWGLFERITDNLGDRRRSRHFAEGDPRVSSGTPRSTLPSFRNRSHRRTDEKLPETRVLAPEERK